MSSMTALRFDRFGDLDELHLTSLDRPVPSPQDVLVEVHASSINPSDVKNVQGKMEGTVPPRTPGRDFAGVVVEGREDLIGAHVYGAGGEIGYEVDGAHAQYVLIPADGVARKPDALDFAQAAASGVNFVAAWLGVNDATHLGAGETVFVTGAAGGVGTAVIQLARWMGARSIGYDRSFPTDLPDSLKPDFMLRESDDIVARTQEFTNGRGAEVVFDTVGAPVFEKNLALLARGGRYTIISSVGERRTSFDILDFYHKRLHLIGVDTRAHHSVAAAKTLERLRPGFESGALQAPHITQRVPLERAIDGYRTVAAGAGGKIVIVME
jgi:NADPH:quinone reductase